MRNLQHAHCPETGQASGDRSDTIRADRQHGDVIRRQSFTVTEQMRSQPISFQRPSGWNTSLAREGVFWPLPVLWRLRLNLLDPIDFLTIVKWGQLAGKGAIGVGLSSGVLLGFFCFVCIKPKKILEEAFYKSKVHINRLGVFFRAP
jgi:hypothetical protein